MTVLSALDSAGRRRSPATMPGYHAGRTPRNKGVCYPADPPTVDEIVAVMRHAPGERHGWRLRAMIVVLWRAGLRVQEALALAEHDLDHLQGIDPEEIIATVRTRHAPMMSASAGLLL
jgi:integrase